jgi:hypothetical protein
VFLLPLIQGSSAIQAGRATGWNSLMLVQHKPSTAVLRQRSLSGWILDQSQPLEPWFLMLVIVYHSGGMMSTKGRLCYNGRIIQKETV